MTELSKNQKWIAALGGLVLGAAGGLSVVRALRRQSFTDQVVVITGGSRGLGLALATELLKQHATVVLLARKSAELTSAKKQLTTQIPDSKDRILTITCDVTDEEALAAAVTRTTARFGRLDGFIHNAGSINVGPFSEFTDEDFESEVSLHLNAAISAVRVTREALSDGGRLLFISSVGGKVGLPHMTPYSASKFGQAGFADAVRGELAEDGISLTVAYPGLMRTGSPKQAFVKGQHEKEFAWFAAADQLPLISMEADRAARQILRAMLDRRSEIIVGWSAKVLVLTRTLAPELTALSMKMVGAMLPDAEPSVAKKGSESRSLFDSLKVLAPLRAMEQKAQDKWNQR